MTAGKPAVDRAEVARGAGMQMQWDASGGTGPGPHPRQVRSAASWPWEQAAVRGHATPCPPEVKRPLEPHGSNVSLQSKARAWLGQIVETRQCCHEETPFDRAIVVSYSKATPQREVIDTPGSNPGLGAKHTRFPVGRGTRLVKGTDERYCVAVDCPRSIKAQSA